MTRGRQALAATLVAAMLASCASTPPASRPTIATQTVPTPIITRPLPEPVAPATITSARDSGIADTGTRSGRDIYRDFRDGLASPQCDDADTHRYAKQFRDAPLRLASEDDGNLLALFGYVVDAFRAASLPTEFALIPFVESGYKPSAHGRSGSGLWQFVTVTARDQGIVIGPRYDGRLSALESTEAATAYFGHLYAEFGNDWKLTVMAYNAGEFRVKTALRGAKKTGRVPGLSPVTYAYVQKLHALSCLFVAAGERDGWLTSLERQEPILHATQLPDDAHSLDAWSLQQGHDPSMMRRLNPDQAIAIGGKRRVLEPTVALWSRQGIGSADVAMQEQSSSRDDATPSSADMASGDTSDTNAKLSTKAKTRPSTKLRRKPRHTPAQAAARANVAK